MSATYWVQISWTVQDVIDYNPIEQGPLLTFQGEALRFLTSSWAGEPFWAFNYTETRWAGVSKGSWDPVSGNFTSSAPDYLILHNDISNSYVVGSQPAPSNLLGPNINYTRHDDLSKSDTTFTMPAWGWSQITVQGITLVGVTADTPIIVEGDSGTKQAGFTISLDQAAVGPISVTYSTQDGTAHGGTSSAVDGADFIQTSGTVTFLAGQTHQTITVPIVGDTIPEGLESFSLRIDGVSASDSTTTPVIDMAHGSAQMQISDGGTLPADTQQTIESAVAVFDLRPGFIKTLGPALSMADPIILEDVAKYGEALEKVSALASIALVVGSRYNALQSDLALAGNDEHKKSLALANWDVNLSNDLAKILFVAATSAYVGATAGGVVGVEVAVVGIAGALGFAVTAAPVVAAVTLAGGLLVAGVTAASVWDSVFSADFKAQQTEVRLTHDGYIQGATVFADSNGNGQLDIGEASATTDASGNFVLFGNSGPLIAFGGTDVSTGLPFKGQYSAPSGSHILSPLTTLVNDLHLSDTSAAQQTILAKLGLPTTLDLTTLDPVAAAQAGDASGSAALMEVAQVYDTVSLISSALAGAGGTFGTASTDTFAAIANALNGTGIDFTNAASMSALIANVAQTENISLGSGVAGNVASIVVASNLLLQSHGHAHASGSQLLNDVAAIELVSQGAASTAIQHATNDPSQFQSIVNAFTGANLDTAFATALNQVAPVQHTIARAERFFDSATGDHFYTLSAAEADQIRATLPTYHDEGAPWGTPDKGTDTVDIFRFFDVATGAHFLTSSTAERDQVLATLPSYHYEGIAFEAYTAPGAGTLTLERFFNTNSHVHTYAASAAETASILSGGAGPGWVDEGAGFIVHT